MKERLLSRSLAIFRLRLCGISKDPEEGVHCEICRGERVQEVTRVERLACRDNTPCLYRAHDDPRRRFHDDRCADGVDIASTCNDTALLSSSPRDHVH